jgi:hypothetical protein
MGSFAVVPINQTSVAKSLFTLEADLVSWFDTVEMVQPEDEEAFIADFQIAMTAAVAKRDAVGGFLAHLDAQVEFAATEIDRLRRRKQAFENASERLKEYVVRTILALGTDAKGKPRKLEGERFSFSIRKNPASLEITDAMAVPPEFKTVTITMPGAVLERVLDALDVELAAEMLERCTDDSIAVDKPRVKAAIAAGDAVPGAQLAEQRFGLVRR